MNHELSNIVDLAALIAHRMDAGKAYSDLDSEMIRHLTPLVVDGPAGALSQLVGAASEIPDAEDVIRAYACNLSLNVTAQAQSHNDRWTTRMTLIGIPLHLTLEPGANAPRFFTERLHDTAMLFCRHQLVLPACSVLLCGGLFSHDDLAREYGQWRRWSVSLAGVLTGDVSAPDLPAPAVTDSSGSPLVRYLVGMVDRGNGCFLDQPSDTRVRQRMAAWCADAGEYIAEIDAVAEASALAPGQLDDALLTGSDLALDSRDSSAA